MKSSLLLCISFIVFLTAPLLHAAEAADPSDHGSTLQEILILNSYHPGYAWSDDEQAGIIDVFRAKDTNWLPVIEYLDLQRLPDGKHLAKLKQLFRSKYQNKKFSVVIAMDNPALEFAIDNQAELFRNAPIVFCGINDYKPSLLKGHPDVTGIEEAIDLAGTIELMLRLHPATQEIFSPQDYTATGLAVRKELEALISRFGAKVRFRFTDPLTMAELLKELERLPKNSLVLERGFITDKSGRTFGVTETTKLFYEHSPVPIYSTYEQQLGFGIVGGKLLGARHHGADAARIALRVLAGEKASAIPVVLESNSQFMFDYKVMSRFGIPLSALPEGSIVINKTVSFYAAHRVVIQTALGIIVFMAVVITLLMINIIQRRRSLEVIRRSEELFKVITSSTPDHLIIQDSDLRYSFVMNPQLDLTEQDMIGKTDHDFLSKEDADKLTEIKRQVLKTGSPFHIETSLISLSGKREFFDGTYVPRFDAHGKVDGLIGYFRNVTDRKRAEEELRTSRLQLRALAARLQQIREEERVMIAREIHDEMGGGLTGLKMDLSWLLRKMGDADPCEERVALMDKIHISNALIDQMIHVVRRISTDLRPSILDDLGLIAALEW
ncbi:MAG TPA: PAS domain-containing protein, partial [Desulfuromonadaceae bacterium]